jgi:ABC-2 type transport system permease protein
MVAVELTHESGFAEFLRQARCAWVIAKKNARVYYLKGPVVTFGIVFPLFFYLAFAAGHSAPVEVMVPGIAAMALFFTASAVGPLVTPWERQARTYERLVTSPASLAAIVAGDVGSGAAFGALLALLPLAAALVLTSA